MLSADCCHGSTVCWHIWMGISELEARLLPAEARTNEVSYLLLWSAQHSRSQPDVSSVVEGHDRAEMDCSDAPALPVRYKGASSDHAHQTAEERRRLRSALLRNN